MAPAQTAFERTGRQSAWRRAAVLVALLVLSSFSLPAQARDIVVYGEPTLKPALESVGALWRARGGARVHVFVAPSDLFFEQIDREACCDVLFALAGPATDAATERELLDEDSKFTVFRNTLVLVARPGLSAKTPTLPAFAARARLAIADPDRDVAGRYGLTALRAAGVEIDTESKTVLVAENAAGVLQMLADGKADVGIVYATDAVANPQFKLVLAFDQASYPAIDYIAAEAAHADENSDGEGFLNFIKSPEAHSDFVAAGLKPPGGEPDKRSAR